jgi:hypothetical protein
MLMTFSWDRYFIIQYEVFSSINVLNTGEVMDQITKQTPNPKCRLYWCWIELIDWRYCQSCWYFRPLLWTSPPLTFSLARLTPFPVWIKKGVCIYTVCNRERGGGWVVWRAYTVQELYTICIWPDSDPTKLLYHPRGPQKDKHPPPGPITGQFWRKAYI